MYTYKLGGLLITDELYHDDLDAMTFGRKDQNELMHYGIKGQSWGKRRFQNEDGSLTAAGRNRYDVGDPKQGVSAYSDTGGRGGSGVSYRATGASRSFSGSSTSQPRARIVTRPQQTSGVKPVSQSVMNRTNNGKKAADNLFGRIGNFASNAAKNVSNSATNAYNNAMQWAGDRAREAGEAVRDTVSNLGNTPEIRDASNAVNGARDWVENAARNVGNFVGDNYNRAREAVAGAANDVGEAAKNVGQKVSDWYTGNPDAQEAERYDNMVQRLEETGDRNINTGNEELGMRKHDLAEQYGKKADEAQARYESAPRQMLDRAGNWIGDRARDVGNAVENVTKDVGETAGEVKNWFSDGTKERKNLIDAREKVDKYADDPEFMRSFAEKYPEEAKQYAEEQREARKQLEQAENDYMKFSNNPVNTVARALNLPNNKGNWAFTVPGNEDYLQTMKTGFIPKTENVADWFTGNNYKRTADTHNEYAKDYDNLADQAYSYARQASEKGDDGWANWYKDEGDYVRNTYAKQDRDIADANMNMYNNAPRQKIVSAAQNVANAVGNAANTAGNWAGNAAKDVGNWGAGAVDKGRQAFENLFGNSKSSSNTNEDVYIPEQLIKEQIIPEQMIYEQTIPEQLIREELIREKRR